MTELGEEAFVHLDIDVRQRLHGKLLRTIAAAVDTKLRRRPTGEGLNKTSAQGFGITWWNQKRIGTLPSYKRVPRDVAGHNRRTGRHGLKKHDPKGLTTKRGRTERIGTREA